MTAVTEYLKKSFQLVYWIFFKPITFEARVNIDRNQEEKIIYRLEKASTLTVFASIPAVLIMGTWVVFAGCLHLSFTPTPNLFNWDAAALSMGGGMIFCVVFGVIESLFFGVAGGVTVGVSMGMVVGMLGGILVGVGAGSDFSGILFFYLVLVTFVSTMTMGMAMSIAVKVLARVFTGIVTGTLTSVFFSSDYGVAGGIALGIFFGGSWILGVFRFHFWLPELLWTLGLNFFSLFTATPPLLRFFPTQFDEWIILPLPFLERFIVENYAINPVATLKKIDYLTNSTNQQKLAANSRISIAVDCLDHCTNITAITLIPDEFSWLPSPLPDDYKFDDAILKLIEIAKDIQSVETASSPYRKLELSQRPYQRLQAVQQNLAFSKSRHRPTLGQITQRWISILKTAKENYETQAANSFEIPPAYIAGNGLEPSASAERFKGRADIFRSIEDISLSDSPPVLLLYGGRRTGKTSSLKYLPNKVDSGLVPLLVDLQGTALSNKLSSFATELARQIIDFAKDRYNLRIDPPNAAKLEDDPFPTLQNWFSEIEQLKPHARFLLCLDEYERLSEVIDATGSKAPLNFLRATMQNNKRWILLFSGSHTPDELEPYWNDALINAQSIRMSYLRRPEAEELIRYPVSDFPDIYTDAAVERVLYWTNCQPYLIQMIGTVLVDTINLEQAEPRNYRITAGDVDRVIDKVIERASQYFSELWRNTLTAQQRENLTQFMLDGHLNGIPQNQIKSLIEKEILYKTDGTYTFQVPITERYLRAQVE